MAFVLSKIGWMILQPGTLLVLALGLIVVLGRMGLKTRVALGIVLAGLLAVGHTPLTTWLLRPLEDRFPPPTPEQVAAAPGIIVLGGAVRLTATVRRPGASLNETAERYVESARLAHAWPDKILAFTGGSGGLFQQSIKEGPIAREIFTDLGIAPERIVIEQESKVTADSPGMLAPLLAEGARGQGWLVVTSAWHMPRTMGVFQADGWQVVPYPVDYLTYPSGGGGPGVVNGLQRLTWAVHEWAGLIAYRVMGRTPAIFPAP